MIYDRCFFISDQNMADVEYNKLLKKLQSTDEKETYSALKQIRSSYARHSSSMKKLAESSVIKNIISFMEHPKFSNISLSIIADACLEEDLTLEVIKNNGIESLVRIMKGLVNDDIQNRACRALGNIAKSKTGFEAVHTMKPISYIIKFLIGTKDKNCQQTAVRTLRILGKDSKSRDIIVRENGIHHIVQLLHSNSKELLLCSSRALAELTETCSVGCARQMIEMQALKILVKLNSHSEEDIRKHALMSLINLSAIDEVRTDLIKIGAAKLFAEVSMNYKSPDIIRPATLALCYCVEHHHIWSNYGLSKHVGFKAVLDVLQLSAFEDLHSPIIHALYPLCYEQGVPDILFELGIIQILIKNLKRFITNNKDYHSDPICEASVLDESATASENQVENEEVEDLNLSSITSLSYKEETLVKRDRSEDFKFSNDIASSSFSKFSNINFEPNLSPVKNIPKYGFSSHLHSSGASTNCSPCSSRSYNVSSPPIYSDSNPSSPLGDPWSPQSNPDMPLCWSPVLSCSEDSFVVEEDVDLNKVVVVEEDVDINKVVEVKKLSQPIPTIEVEKKITSASHQSDSTVYSEYINRSNTSILTGDEKDELQNFTKLDTLPDSQKSPIPRKHKASAESQLSLEETSANKKIKLSSPSKLSQKIELPCVYDRFILALLSLLSYHIDKKNNSEIASRESFSVLLEYMVSVKNPNSKAEKILLNLAKNRYAFEKLIMSGFVTEMDKILTISHSAETCIRCSQIHNIYSNLLSTLQPEAESYYGIGTLYHILSTSEQSSQIYAIHAISILIHNKEALIKLLFHGNGLSVLFNYLSGESDANTAITILSLCKIYQNLKKTKIVFELEKCCFSRSCRLRVGSKCTYLEDTSYNVTFLINDQKVLASREILCQKSDYFRALLEGHFSESKKDTITMSSISAEALTALFHFLHGCQSKNICCHIKNITCTELLELLSICEEFLLFDLKSFVVDQLCHNISPSTISDICQVAKTYNSLALYKKALHFGFSMSISQKDAQLKFFEDLMKIENFNVLEDMKSLIIGEFHRMCPYATF